MTENMSLAQKTAFLRGLIKGKGIDDEVTVLITEILGELATKLESIDYRAENIEDRMDSVEDDVADLRELQEEYFSDLYDGKAHDDPPITEYDFDEDYEDEDGDEDGIYELTCPSCGEKLYLSDDEIADGTVACPLCGEPLELILDEDENGEDGTEGE